MQKFTRQDCDALDAKVYALDAKVYAPGLRRAAGARIATRGGRQDRDARRATGGGRLDCDARRATRDGRRATGGGRRAAGDGRRATGGGRRAAGSRFCTYIMSEHCDAQRAAGCAAGCASQCSDDGRPAARRNAQTTGGPQRVAMLRRRAAGARIATRCGLRAGPLPGNRDPPRRAVNSALHERALASFQN
jgi:hypothetical protein